MKTLEKLSYDCIKLGGTSAGWLGHLLYVVVTNPEDLEKVLKSCMEKDDLHRFHRNITGYGSIFAPVHIWKPRRKIMMPAFAPKVVESFLDIFVKQSGKLVKNLEASSGTGQFSIWHFVNRYALESVCEAALGVEIRAQDDRKLAFLAAVNKAVDLVSERIFHIWLQPDWIYKLFRTKYAKHEECRRVLLDFVDWVVMEKRKEIAAKKGTKEEDLIRLDNSKSATFMDLLMKSSGDENGYTDVELREELLTIMLAASDTSAVAICTTLVLLRKYPDVQEKVYDELKSVLKDTNRHLVKEDLPKLKYLERVIKESLRLYPPVPFIVRKVTTETTLPSGCILPVGSGVVISIWGAHRDTKYWGPDADCFDPDRFLPERHSMLDPCCYLPFSSGPRNCVGSQFAMMSMKISLSTILRAYKIVGPTENGPIPQIRTKLDLLMKAVDGYQIGLEKRNK